MEGIEERAHGRPPRTVPLAMTACACLLAAASCDPAREAEALPEGPARVLHDAIERHGGDRFARSRITFTFRDAEVEVRQDGGLFRYERRYTDGEGREILEVMDNDGTRMEVGEPAPLDPAGIHRVETEVNSTVYFGFLPFRLLDPAANHRDLGTTEVMGEPYRMIEVTFDPEGGGTDWEDRFVHWIHEEEGTLDYFAYRYHRDGGGTRFRRAINRREVGGLLIQDFENYRAEGASVEDIADYGRLFEAGAVELLSVLELEDVQVEALR